MIQPTNIYTIQPRGQVVNVACQWIVQHRKLCFRFFLMPIIILGTLLFINYLIFESNIFYGVLLSFFVILLPPIPNSLIHITENPQQYNYPDQLPKFRQMMPLWWKYIKSIIGVSCSFVILNAIAYITFVGPIVLPLIYPLAITAYQRDDNLNIFTCYLTATKLILRNIIDYLLCLLGLCFIAASLTIAPVVMVVTLVLYIQNFFNQQTIDFMKELIDENELLNILLFICYCFCVVIGMIFMVISTFFYGHAIEKSEHPTLIKKLQSFPLSP